MSADRSREEGEEENQAERFRPKFQNCLLDEH